MANITIRNIPDEVFAQIKELSAVERRSLNNELLVIIERGARAELDEVQRKPKPISRSVQVHLWRTLAGVWEDIRSTEAIVADIYDGRSLGREVDL